MFLCPVTFGRSYLWLEKKSKEYYDLGLDYGTAYRLVHGVTYNYPKHCRLVFKKISVSIDHEIDRY